MTKADIAEMGLAQAALRFPEAAESLRRIAGADATFRALCEEYALAQRSLAGFEARLDAGERPEVGEYRTVIEELELEIDQYLRADREQRRLQTQRKDQDRP